MDIFRSFRLILNNPRVKRNPLLTSQSDKNISRIFTAWFVSAYAVALIAEASELSFSSCYFCIQIAQWVPSILVMAQGSYEPDAMRFVLLYHTVSAPIWLVMMWVFASDFRRLNMLWWGYPFCVGVFILFSYTSLYGVNFGGADAAGKLNKMYYNFLFISTMITTAFWALSVFFIYFFWFFLVFFRIYRWIRRT